MYQNEVDMKMHQLPEDLRRQVLDYMEFLIEKNKVSRNKGKKFKFDWEGGLSEIQGELTSVELQHRVLEWR